MYKLCKTEQSSARQRQLEQSLLHAMKHKRYEDISITDLCAQMQIPRKVFYRYFTSKDGALYALLDHTMMEFFQQRVQSGSYTAPTSIEDLERFFLFWYQHRELLDALQHSSLSGMLVERATQLALQEQAMPRVMRNWDKGTQSIAMTFAVSGLLAMVIRWHAQGFPISPAQLTQIATAILCKPLITL